jgi:hypothetical protein
MPAPADEPDQALRSADTRAPNGRTVGGQLALRPEFSAQARMPSTTLPCATMREAGLLVWLRGRWRYLYGRYPTGPVASSLPMNARGVHAVFLPRDPIGGTGTLDDHDADGTQLGSA